jgi:hypothetical protein
MAVRREVGHHYGRSGTPPFWLSLPYHRYRFDFAGRDEHERIFQDSAAAAGFERVTKPGFDKVTAACEGQQANL